MCLKRGTVLDQYYSALRLNVIYFFVGRAEVPCREGDLREKTRPPRRPGRRAYKGPWADLVTKVKAIHGLAVAKITGCPQKSTGRRRDEAGQGERHFVIRSPFRGRLAAAGRAP